MIENLFGGGGGGTVDTITAGTGISVNSTDPANPIITNTSLNTDEVAKVSSNDTTAGYLNGKLVAGSNVTLTENNNGGNETLTIAATVPVTSVNTKTGAVTLTNTDVGAAATSHTHAASDITSGVIATARLGSGTASSSTALFGDQSYKNVVTSVNGSSGAVTVAAGDTTYALTVADAENTTAEITLVSYTIPANTFANGEIIFLWMLTQFLNNSGVNPCEVRHRIKINGTEVANFAVNQGIVSTANTYWEYLYLWRDGSTLRGPNPTANSHQHNTVSTNTVPSGWRASDRWSATPSFTSDITVTHTVQLGVANASTYLRVMNARVSKTNGQYT